MTPAPPDHTDRRPKDVSPPPGAGGARQVVGPVGRLGRWTAAHFRVVLAGWAVPAIGLLVVAPRAETALSGAGWHATGSESVRARALVDRSFDGLGSYGPTVVVHSGDRTVADPVFRRVLRDVQARLRSDPAVRTVVPPRAPSTISA